MIVAEREFNDCRNEKEKIYPKASLCRCLKIQLKLPGYSPELERYIKTENSYRIMINHYAYVETRSPEMHKLGSFCEFPFP